LVVADRVGQCGAFGPTSVNANDCGDTNVLCQTTPNENGCDCAIVCDETGDGYDFRSENESDDFSDSFDEIWTLIVNETSFYRHCVNVPDAIRSLNHHRFSDHISSRLRYHLLRCGCPHENSF